MTEQKTSLVARIGVVLLAAITVAAWLTGHWFLTAIPIGVLFGFFLQKGDLCGSSAFSEVVLARDWRKVWGLWVAIVVSMLGIALGDLLGWIQLNPKPFMWAGAVAGGVVFGIGMVLAGGCVSGCLYKGAAGNLNSIVALLAMPLGIGLVEYGPLQGWLTRLKQIRIPASDGGPVTLSSATGLPFWTLALILAGATLGWAVMRRRRTGSGGEPPTDASGLPRLNRPWKAWQAGIAIGLLALPAYLSSAASGRNYPLGVTHGVLHASLLLTDAPLQHITGVVKAAPTSSDPAPPTPRKKIVWWLVLLVGSLMVGSHVAGRLSGEVHLLPKPPEQVLVAAAGGFLVGAGAALATGCVIGNILSGLALMSVGMLLFTVVTILANWATTLVYLRGVR
ncbi:MAG: YeeE/YedE family protein [Acidobacteria bacterium]|jgi:hypothetical protein|nr:YeeE/YedE family protein [Acidobacteriota bacterium]